MVDQQSVAQWLSRLVRVPSVTPLQAGTRAGAPGAPGAPGEAVLAEQVAQWFAFGGEVFVDEFLPGRPNIIGIFRGKTARLAGVDAHMDTVGVETFEGDPFSGRIDAGRVWGRGATDTKAALAVALALLEDMHRRGVQPEPTLLIAATSDEEGTARGAPALAAWLRRRGMALDEMAVAEPTHGGPVYGHKGVLRLVFTIQGRACHSSQPHLGKNAVSAGVRVALAMERDHERLLASAGKNPLGPGTLTVTMFQGGEGVSIVPPTCRVTIDRRITWDEKTADERERLSSFAREASPLPLEVETVHEIDSFYQDPAAPWVRRMSEWSGREPGIVPYCTNAWAYTPDVARQCVVIGPGSIEQAHTKDEWVSVDELSELASVFANWWGV